MALETSSLLVWMLNIPKLCSKVASWAAKLVAATQSLCGRRTRKGGECLWTDNMKSTSIFASLTWACRHCNSTRMLYAWYSPHSWWQVKRHNWEKEIHELLLYNSFATRMKNLSDTLDLPVGQEASKNDVLCSFLTQKKVEVGAWKDHGANPMERRQKSAPEQSKKMISTPTNSSPRFMARNTVGSWLTSEGTKTRLSFYDQVTLLGHHRGWQNEAKYVRKLYWNYCLLHSPRRTSSLPAKSAPHSPLVKALPSLTPARMP